MSVNADLSFATRLEAVEAPQRIVDWNDIDVAAGIFSANQGGVDIGTAQERLRQAAARAGHHRAPGRPCGAWTPDALEARRAATGSALASPRWPQRPVGIRTGIGDQASKVGRRGGDLVTMWRHDLVGPPAYYVRVGGW